MEESKLPIEKELEQILGLEENAECHEAENEEPAGMGCSCRNLRPDFLDLIDAHITRVAPSLVDNPQWLQSLRGDLKALAKNCGYEKDAEGHWIQWPKREAILEELGTYIIVKEHDDGDLTLDTVDGKVIVTTEGKVFYEKKD